MQSAHFSCQISTKFQFFPTDFQKMLNPKLRENAFSDSQIYACGQTDMAKLIVPFRYLIQIQGLEKSK